MPTGASKRKDSIFLDSRTFYQVRSHKSKSCGCLRHNVIEVFYEYLIRFSKLFTPTYLLAASMRAGANSKNVKNFMRLDFMLMLHSEIIVLT